MLFAESVFMGLVSTAGKRPMCFAALDKDLRLLVLESGNMQSALAHVAGMRPAAVAVTSPQAPNRGCMLRPEVRRGFNLRQEGQTWGDWRVCEYELRRRNIRMYSTPAKKKDSRGWVRCGFSLYRHLQSMGYRFYVSGEETQERLMIEAPPHAFYAALLGHRPFLKRSLEGRLQRQLVLFLEGLDIPNPMRSLEEITRHRLLTGNLPLDKLYEFEKLDALAAAYCAYLSKVKPERTCQVGDREEGLITLPVEELREFYH
jgi:predicted nuclease with RNAse H fold